MNNNDLDDEQANNADDEHDDQQEHQEHHLQNLIQHELEEQHIHNWIQQEQDAWEAEDAFEIEHIQQEHQEQHLQHLIQQMQQLENVIQQQHQVHHPPNPIQQEQQEQHLQHLILNVQLLQNLIQQEQQAWEAEDDEDEIQEMFHGNTALSPTFAFKLHNLEHVRSDGNTPCGELGRRGLADHNYAYTYGRHRTFDATDEVVEIKEQMWEYNVSNCSWKLLRELMPTPEHFRYSEVFLTSKCLFVLQQSDYFTSDVLHVYDRRISEWLVVHMSGTLPPRLLGQCCTMVNSSIYLYGGIADIDEVKTHLFQLNLKDFLWKEIVTEEPPSYECCQKMANDGVYLYIFGCGNQESVSALVDVLAFDIAAAKWFKVRSNPDLKATILMSGTIEGGFPRSRCHATFVQINNDVVYLCGGSIDQWQFKDIWSFHMKTRSWFRLPCKIPRGNYCIAVLPNGCMYFFQNNGHNVRRIWLTKVTLQEMCWQALLHYVGSDKKISKTQWQQLGVPPRLLENLYEK